MITPSSRGYFGGAGVKISRLAGSGFGFGLGAFFVSFRPLSLFPMAESMTQTGRSGKAQNLLSSVFLLGWGSSLQLIVVENRIENQGVVADGLAAVDRVVAEEQHAALAEMRVDYDGVLGD